MHGSSKHALRYRSVFGFSDFSGYNLRSVSRPKSHRSLTPELPIIRICNATFYDEHPSPPHGFGQENASKRALFSRLSFAFPTLSSDRQKWAVISESSIVVTTFLQVLRGQYLCFPPTARSYPYLATQEILTKDSRLRLPANALQYVGFEADRKSVGPYLSARYESRKEATDISLLDYLKGHTELSSRNAAQDITAEETLHRVTKDLQLDDLIHMPANTLSSGQKRRARIAKHLMRRPEALLLDKPFMNLDPLTALKLGGYLQKLSEAASLLLFLGLGPQDDVPEWITHLVYADKEFNVLGIGPRNEIIETLRDLSTQLPPGIGNTPVARPVDAIGAVGGTTRPNVNTVTFTSGTDVSGRSKEILIDMEGVKIKYGQRIILGDWTQKVNGRNKEGLWWRVRRGQRWGLFGPNGSGKSTLLSLITSDHPQSYSEPIRLFQCSRLPSPGIPGISIFDLQSRMGHSSAEVHALFPRGLTIRRVLRSAWADTPLSKPSVSHEANEIINSSLIFFREELRPNIQLMPSQVSSNFTDQQWRKGGNRKTEQENELSWADEVLFRDLSFSGQRVALFLRALVRSPDVVILDEAFSGMDDVSRHKCFQFLAHGGAKMRNSDETAGESKFVGARERSCMMGLQEHQTLIVVSHRREEVPDCIDEWMVLPEAGQGSPRFGHFHAPLSSDPQAWSALWQRATQLD